MESASISAPDWTFEVRTISNSGSSLRVCKFSTQMTHLDAKSIRENNQDEVISKANWLRFDGPWSGAEVARHDQRRDPNAEVAGSIPTLCTICSQASKLRFASFPRRSALSNDVCSFFYALCIMFQIPTFRALLAGTTLSKETRFVFGTQSECDQTARLLREPRFDSFAITNFAHAILKADLSGGKVFTAHGFPCVARPLLPTRRL